MFLTKNYRGNFFNTDCITSVFALKELLTTASLLSVTICLTFTGICPGLYSVLFFHNSNDGMLEKPQAKKDLIKKKKKQQMQLIIQLLLQTDDTHMLNTPHLGEDA